MRASTLLTLVNAALLGIGASPTLNFQLHDDNPSQPDPPVALSPFAQPAEVTWSWHGWVLGGIRRVLYGAEGRRLQESPCPDVSLQLLKLSICSTDYMDRPLDAVRAPPQGLPPHAPLRHSVFGVQLPSIELKQKVRKLREKTMG